MNKLLRHVRSNAVAYVALFVALGGTSYAALRIPANSVGNRQIKNGAITPVKINRHLITGSVRAWAEVSARGRVLAGEGGPTVVPRTGPDSTGQYLVTWNTESFARCAAVGGIESPAPLPLTPGSVIATSESPPDDTTALVDVFNAQGQAAALPFWTAILC
jgi:hypothetical protein